MRLAVLCLCFFSAAVVAEKPAATTTTSEKSTSQSTFDASKGFSSVVDKLLPAVVSVQATQVVEQRPGEGGGMPGFPPMGRMGPNNPLEELFREFMGQQERPRKMQAVGAGFIVYCDGKIAYVVSNHHVVFEAKTLTIVLEDKTEIPGTLLASDERNDVAVIKLDLSNLPADKRNLPTVDWADSDKVKTGDWVIAIGNPFNFGGTVTVGVVSHKGRYVPSGIQQDFEFIQHSAQINVGSSGGALFDVNGKVIGINNAIITNTGGNIGIGFAIPANVARQTVDQLVKYGKTRRGHLGIRIQGLNEDMAESQGLKDTGVIVGSVIEGGPSVGKLESGDIILEFEGKKITESYILSRMVGETEIGKTVTLKVWRKGKAIEVKIKVEEMPEAKKTDNKAKIASENISESINIAGLEISKIPEDLKEALKEANKEVRGVMIVRIDPNSTAGDQGLLRKGDIIEEANHKALELPSDFEAIVKQAKKDKRKNILLLISRDGKPSYLPLRIDGDDLASKAADNNNAAGKKPEEVKPDVAKAEAKPEAAKVEEPKQQKSKAEEIKPEAKKQETKKPESNLEAQKSEGAKPGEQKIEQAGQEAIKTYQAPENLKHQAFDDHKSDEDHKQDEAPDVQDADHEQGKESVSNTPLATDNKNALQVERDDLWTSRVVNKLRSIFGRG
jgi:serine protease Do